jgi:transcription initiation factor IIE alpha subunit
MTRQQWCLARQAEAVLRRDTGRRDDELASAIGVTVAELVPVLKVLYRQRRIDRCWAWTVAPPERRAP